MKLKSWKFGIKKKNKKLTHRFKMKNYNKLKILKKKRQKILIIMIKM